MKGQRGLTVISAVERAVQGDGLPVVREGIRDAERLRQLLRGRQQLLLPPMWIGAVIIIQRQRFTQIDEGSKWQLSFQIAEQAGIVRRRIRQIGRGECQFVRDEREGDHVVICREKRSYSD